MIYVECDADYVFVRTLGIDKKEIFCVGGKGEVCNILERGENLIGLIDEDPLSLQPSYIKKLKPKLNLEKYGIQVLQDKEKNNYIIFLCPRLEEWLLKAAQEAKIDIKKYGLPNDSRILHKIINIRAKNLEKLLRNLQEKSERIKFLKELLIKKNF